MGVIGRYRDHLAVTAATPEDGLNEGSTPLVAGRNNPRTLDHRHLN